MTLDSYDHLPLSFEPNVGQTAPEVRYLAHGSGDTLYLTGHEAVLSLWTAHRHSYARDLTTTQGLSATTPISAAVLRLGFAGATLNPDPQVTGADPLPGKSTYLVGTDPRAWHHDIATYGRVTYHDLYPGIDLSYYGTARRLEYDYVLAPGADPGAISLTVQGTQQVRVDPTGALLLRTGSGTVRQEQPVAYQEIDGRRHTVSVQYTLASGADGDTVGFAVGSYDPGQPLVIDPVLTYSSYLGGTGTDEGRGMTVDGAGNAYVTGWTNGGSFPTTNGAQTTFGGDHDAFVTEINASGSAVVYSTYLGGSGGDYGVGITVDPAGNAYVTGCTSSSDFPLANALQAQFGGGGLDGFVAELSPGGSALRYSSYLGGSGAEVGSGIAVDGQGNVYVTGQTGSLDFETTPAAYRTNATGRDDAFVTKLNVVSNVLAYSTYLGGGSDDRAYGIALDAAGDAYVTGTTASTNFPLKNAVQSSHGPGLFNAFLSEVNPSGSGLIYSTYLGGSGEDRGYGIAVNGSGTAYVTGWTSSSDFPTTTGVVQGTYGGGLYDGFVTALNTAATGSASLVYSTYLGGSVEDYGNGIAVDSSGNAYIAGGTDSSNFPTQNAVQATYNAGGNTCANPNGTMTPCPDAFVTELTPSGGLVYSTYLGGTRDNRAYGIALDGARGVYIMGETSSSDVPVVNGFQGHNGGNVGTYDAFVAKLAPGIAINTGGGAAGSFAADAYYSGGTSSSTNVAIDTSGVANPAPQAVYQSERWGVFSYVMPNLVPGAPYTVRLHFAELVATAAGQRLFNVAINGTSVLSNFDIYATAGGPDRAIVEEFPTTADSNGQITIAYTSSNNNAKSSGIEIIARPTGVPAAGYGLTFTNAAHTAVQIPDAPGLRLSTNFTLESWIYQTAAANGYRLVDKETAGTGDGFLFDTYDPNGSGRRLRLCGNGACASENSTYTLNQWHHVAVVVSGTSATFYLDGVADGGGSVGAIQQNTLNLYLGAPHYGSGCGCGVAEYFNGTMDEVRLWSVARTQQQIQQTMNRTLTGTEANLAGYWRFDEGSGTTTVDGSGQGHTGTLLNGPGWVVSTAPLAPARAASCPRGWGCDDIGFSSPTGSQSFDGTTWTVTGGGPDIWGSSDRFHYVWQPVAGDSSISGRVLTQGITGQYPKAGFMYRASTDPSAPFYMVLEEASYGICVNTRTTPGGSTGAPACMGSTLPAYLRIGRAGNTLTTYTSSDGNTWTALANSSVTINGMPRTALTGLAVDSNNVGLVSTATFDAVVVSACPSGWSCGDIGSPSVTGSQALVGAAWTVRGSGAEIWGGFDQFHYVWQSVAGDGSLSARVTGQSNTGALAKAGLMYRASTDAAAPFYAVFAAPGNGGTILVETRTAPGSPVVGVAVASGLPPLSLRIGRAGATFTAYRSSDGVSWTAIANSSVTLSTLPGTALAGLAVDAYNAGALSTATFDAVTLTGLTDWWKGEGDATDAAGPNNGTLNTTGFAPGRVGQAFSFNGSNTSVNFGPTAGNFGAGDFTIQFWIKTTQTAFTGILGKRPVCGHGYFWDIRGSATGLNLEMDQNNMIYFGVATTKPLGDGAYHLITFVRQGTVVRAYTDGSLDAQASAPAAPNLDNSTALTAGRSACTGQDGTGWFNGQLDEIKLYNGARSDAEIAGDYAIPAVAAGLSYYPYRQQVTVTNNDSNATLAGSATAPVATTSQDYVAQLHLSGPQAAFVYNEAADQTGFTDVTLWYTGGGAPRQFDLDADTAIYGAWSPDNITLWFKLQAPIGPGGADSNYVLAWGNPNAVVKRTWANIYPLQDDFTAGVLDPSRWTGVGNVMVANGAVTVNHTGSGTRTDMGIYSSATYGTGYAVNLRTQLGPLLSGQYNTPGLQNGLSSSPFYAPSSAGSGSTTSWLGYSYNNGPSGVAPAIGPLDPAYRVYTVARDGTGNPYYWRDADAPTQVPNEAATAALNVVLHTTNFTSSAFTHTTDWIKVRPWLPSEPTTTMGAVLASPCPGGWNCADIGSPPLSGGQGLGNGTWSVLGSGADIYGTADQFHYAWQPVAGDVDLSARITGQANTGPCALSGLMYRSDTSAGAANYTVGLTPNCGGNTEIVVQYRPPSAPGQGAQQTLVMAQMAGTLPVYLRLTRVGPLLTAYTSSDGSVWTPIAGSSVTTTMGVAALAGLAVDSFNGSAMGSATLDQVRLSVTPPAATPAPTATNTATATGAPTSTATPSATGTPAGMPTATPTGTPASTLAPPSTATTTSTATPTVAPTASATAAGTPTALVVDDSVQGQTLNRFSYGGLGWQPCASCDSGHAGYYNGSLTSDNTANDTVTIVFRGRGITLYGARLPGGGQATVSLDGQRADGTPGADLVDFYAAVAQGNQAVYPPAGAVPLAAGVAHTLTVRVSRTKQAQSTDYYVSIDRVVIAP